MGLDTSLLQATEPSNVHVTYTEADDSGLSSKESLQLNNWLPKFNFRTSEGHVRFLVDTGAVQSFVTEDFRSSPRFCEKKIEKSYRVTDGDCLEIFGTVDIAVRIDKEKYKHLFLVANVRTNLLRSG